MEEQLGEALGGYGLGDLEKWVMLFGTESEKFFKL